MKKLFTLLVLSVILFACSSDDEEVVPKLNVNTETLNFTFDREERSLIIDTNTGWTAETDAEWLSLSSASGTGPATIEILSAYNGTDKNRSAKITIKGDNIVVYVTINQNKLPETSGLYILSEGNWNMNQAELAYYDIESDNIQKKYFFTQNNTDLGDTGNDLAIYGSKMYCVVSGANIDNGGYIEIITPQTGKSQKRILLKDSEGKNDQPRKITFHKNKAYITTYSGSVVRLDTTSLEIDAQIKLNGTFPEGICVYNRQLYVCNSGQGTGNSISVVDIPSFKETKTITVPQNPVAICATQEGNIYFTTADLSWLNGTPSNLHLLNAETGQVTRSFDIRASRLALGKDYVYTVDNITNWNTFETTDYNYKINLKSQEVSVFTNDLWDYFMAYNINVNKANDDVYILGQGQDIAIFNSEGTLKKKLKTGTGYGNSVIPIFK